MGGRRNNPRPTRRAEGKIDLYNNWLKNIRNASVGRIVLVKNKRAKDVLEALKVKNVISYNEAKPEYKLFDMLSKKNKEVILLFGADRVKNALCEKIKSELQQRKIKTNTRFRKPLFADNVKDLDGLLNFLHQHVADSPRKHRGVKY